MYLCNKIKRDLACGTAAYCMATVITVMKSKEYERGVTSDVYGREKIHVGFWWGNLKVKLTVGISRQRVEDNSEMDLKRNRMGGGGRWTGMSG